MARFLLFTLYAPIAALGAIAVGERRMGWERPGRSAVLGLVAAALGLDRAEEAAHAALEAGYGYAVRVDAPGRTLVDYHTTQTLSESGRRKAAKRLGRPLRTRADEMAEEGHETILSWREYRTDALYTVALWERDGAPHPLAAIGAALVRPRFVLYLGRKACPLGFPLCPAVVEAATLDEALRARPAVPDARDGGPGPRPDEALRRALGPRSRRTVAADADAPVAANAVRTETRRDRVQSRRRWQFADRGEAVYWMDHPEEAP